MRTPNRNQLCHGIIVYNEYLPVSKGITQGGVNVSIVGVWKYQFYIKFWYKMKTFQNDINYCLRQVHPWIVCMEDKSLVDCLHTLIMAISNQVIVEGFEMEQLDFIVNSIACQ